MPPNVLRVCVTSVCAASYQRLLQTIGVLEAQRTQAILDLEVLARHQQQALSDPVGFVERLQKQVWLRAPFSALISTDRYDSSVFLSVCFMLSRLCTLRLGCAALFPNPWGLPPPPVKLSVLGSGGLSYRST